MIDDEFTIWRLARYFEVLLPCPIDQVNRRLPTGVAPFEPMPGYGLVSVGCLRFHAGNLGELPAFDELTLAISIVNPAPESASQFNFYTVSITSPNPRFLELATELDKMPASTLPGLQFAWRDGPAGVRVTDEHGPIVELSLHGPATPTALDIPAHSLQARGEEVWLSRARWNGDGCLMAMPACDVRVHPHRFWGDLPLAQLGPPMMALVAGPGEYSFGFSRPQRWTGPR